MKKILLAATALLIAAPAFAQAPTIAPAPTADEMKVPRPPRARGIPTALAIEGAVAARTNARETPPNAPQTLPRESAHATSDP